MQRLVRVTGVALGSLALIVAAFVAYVQLAWDRPSHRPVVALNAPRDAANVLKGQYLYERSLLCWDCHGSQGSRSPAEPQAGGREFDMTRIGPGFGYVYGSNLTPDPATGIGGWSDGELVRAIREGIDRDGRLIFPVMAYQFYHGLSDDDALALVAYLRSLAPVRATKFPPGASPSRRRRCWRSRSSDPNRRSRRRSRRRVPRQRPSMASILRGGGQAVPNVTRRAIRRPRVWTRPGRSPGDSSRFPNEGSRPPDRTSRRTSRPGSAGGRRSSS